MLIAVFPQYTYRSVCGDISKKRSGEITIKGRAQLAFHEEKQSSAGQSGAIGVAKGTGKGGSNGARGPDGGKGLVVSRR